MYSSSYKTFVVLLTAFVATVAAHPTSADDQFPTASTGQRAMEPFPSTVAFRGFLRRSGSTWFLVDIEGQKFFLKERTDMEVSIDGAPLVSRLRVEEFDFVNRRIRLGFPQSGYRPKYCTMASQ